jgi:hypothetical protein
MTQTLGPSRWLRLLGAALISLTLVLISILLLQSGKVQARPELSGDSLADARFNDSLNAPNTPVLSITVEATSTVVVPGQIVTYSIEFGQVGGTSPIQAQMVNLFESNTMPHVDGMLVEVVGSTSPDVVLVSYGVPAFDTPGTAVL